MRYWICDISSPGGGRFEMDLDEPPAEGSVVAPGTYKVIAVVSLASEISPGVIEVEPVTVFAPAPSGV
jgi:hypothetical protein